ncbi:MAG: hypothetical protein JSU87_03635 [Gemmatimonadota bacterium]|nr:MAG: hypothetical protein JSU87_03635 [Gemmatimonadota bacterium]
MKRKWMRLALPVLLISAIAVGCGDDDGDTTGVTIDDLAGTWVANEASTGTKVELTLNAAPATTIEIVTLGGTASLTITTSERFTLVVDVPGLGGGTFTGSFTISGRNFTLTTDDDPDDPITGTFTLSGNTLEVRASDVEIFDVIPPEGVGPEDAALLEAVFGRSS